MSPSPIQSLKSPSSQTIEELHVSRKATGSLQEATLNTQVGQPPHAEQILEVRQSQPSHLLQGVSGGNPISSRTEDIDDLVEELTCSALLLPLPSPLSPSLAGASSQNPIIIDLDDGTPLARQSPPSSPLRLLASGRLGSVRSEGLTMSATFPALSSPTMPRVAASTAATPPPDLSPAVVQDSTASHTPSEPPSEQSLMADLPPFPQHGAPGIPLIAVQRQYDEVEESQLHRHAVSTALQAALEAARTEELCLTAADRREEEALKSCHLNLNRLKAVHSKAPSPSDAPTSPVTSSPGTSVLRRRNRAEFRVPSRTKRVRIGSAHSEPVGKGKAKARFKLRSSPSLPYEDAGMYSDGTGEYVDPSSDSAPASRPRASKWVGVRSRLMPRRVRPSSIGKGKAKAKKGTPPPPDDDDEPIEFGAMDDAIASIVLDPPPPSPPGVSFLHPTLPDPRMCRRLRRTGRRPSCVDSNSWIPMNGTRRIHQNQSGRVGVWQGSQKHEA